MIRINKKTDTPFPDINKYRIGKWDIKMEDNFLHHLFCLIFFIMFLLMGFIEGAFAVFAYVVVGLLHEIRMMLLWFYDNQYRK